uniref:NADH-ubiquinone oxidoreductase chain 2 n=1 Tax=Opisthopatus cinctipes TaxID=574546 RepID=D7QYT4_9BILA|nr:NADH dehydrogenase subunit 2 [Opisthopatus cinctipes]ADE05864.1 NADH dehydrogenase subunit 2 [Opisthopatus cinctipes]
MLFYLILFMSIMFQISSTTWFSLWVAMEMNLLSFIPLLSNPKNMLFNEGPMKYFLIQAFGSVILLMGWLMNSYSYLNNMYLFSMSNVIFYISLMLKLGAAPFHFWFPSLMENMSWLNSFLLMTWQKLGPLILLTYISKLLFFLMMSSFFSSLVGGLGGLNQVSMRKIFAYSSIGHISWLLMSLMLNELNFILYYLFYFFMMFLFSLIFYLNLISSLMQLLFYKESFYMEKFFIMLSFLSLGGMPPLSGFFVKWMILNSLLIMNIWFISFVMLFSTLINLYYYIRIFYSTMMLSNFSPMMISFKFSFKYLYLIKLIILMMMFSVLFIPIGIWVL